MSPFHGVWSFRNGQLYELQILSGLIHLLHCGVIHRLQQRPPCSTASQPASLWSSPWAAGKCLLWHMEHLFSFLLWPSCLQDCFSYIFIDLLSQLLCSIFFLLFLKYVITRALSLFLMSSTLTRSRSFLELTLSNMGADSSHRGHFLQIPDYQNLVI